MLKCCHKQKTPLAGGVWVWRTLQRHHRMECCQMQESIGSIAHPPDTKISQLSKLFGRRKDVLATFVFRILGQNLWDKSHILFSSLQSCLGHIRTQLATGRGFVSLGPSMEQLPQSYRRNPRTLARKQGIENLQATHPWADLQDLEIFLAGFDAGEQYILCTVESNRTTDPCSLEAASECLSFQNRVI